MLGTALAGGTAFAQQEEPQEQTSEYGQEIGQEHEQLPAMRHGVSDMSAGELEGLTVLTESGEEVGEIDRVGESEKYQARVATVDVGGFLGIAEKTIAIPLSELEMTSDGNLRTHLTKASIQSREDFDEEGFTEEGEEDTGY
jgi:hypothetical protein